MNVTALVALVIAFGIVYMMARLILPRLIVTSDASRMDQNQQKSSR